MIVMVDSREGGTQTLKGPRVFAADGPSSTIRKIQSPVVNRTYVGKVCGAN